MTLLTNKFVGEIRRRCFDNGKINESYEAVLVFNTKLGEEGIKALVAKFTELIESNGTLDLVNEWGKRSLLMLLRTKQRLLCIV